MKEFRQLETGVWLHTDCKGRIHVYTADELETYLQSSIWLRKIKSYLGLCV
jgi:hypothetical protein